MPYLQCTIYRFQMCKSIFAQIRQHYHTTQSIFMPQFTKNITKISVHIIQNHARLCRTTTRPDELQLRSSFISCSSSGAILATSWNTLQNYIFKLPVTCVTNKHGAPNNTPPNNFIELSCGKVNSGSHRIN